jgi:hypothetical protein
MFSQTLKTARAHNEKQAIRELIEDSPYKFCHCTPPRHPGTLIDENRELHQTFKQVYTQFLTLLAQGDMPQIK